MDAMIFAAGLGTRLKPITDTVPKALVKVGEKTMLERTIENVKLDCVERIMVNVHHHAPIIRQWLKTHYPEVLISDESEFLLETGGGLAKVIRDFNPGDNILVMNADILSDIKLDIMAKKHVDSGSDITLVAFRRPTSRYLLFDNHRLMRGWTNITTGEFRPAKAADMKLQPLAFGGIHILSRNAQNKLLEYSAGRTKFSIIDFYIAFCNNLSIRAFIPEQPFTWIDIGKPESLALARQTVV